MKTSPGSFPSGGNKAYLSAVIVSLLLGSAAAQDTVYIAAGTTGGRTKVTGQIVDYTGKELRMTLLGGRQRSFPAGQVLQIETQYGDLHTKAEGLFAKGLFDQALSLYRQAIDAEPRRWVRRQIIARIVWCYRALGRPDRAGGAFLVLIRSDPSTPYFDCIPLAWTPRQPPIALERAARQWIADNQPAAVLLGASHLLTTGDRSGALEQLRRLSAAAGDRRIAQLAMAQTWRAAMITADSKQIDTWEGAADNMPERLAAGAYLVVGRARARLRQWEPAALALLRVAILYPQHRELAARALLEAGRALEGLDRKAEAARLYRELIRNYPQQTLSVAEAQKRMEGMRKKE